MTGYIPVIFYIAVIIGIFLSLFYKAKIGIFFLVPLIQVEALKAKIEVFPQGNNIVDFLLLAVLLKTFINGDMGKIKSTPLFKYVIALVLITGVSIVVGHGVGAFQPSNPYFVAWKNFLLMPIIFVLVYCNLKDEKMVIYLFGAIVLSMMANDLKFHFTFQHLGGDHFHHGMRFSILKNFGPNEMAALVAQTTGMLVAMLFFVEDKKIKIAIVCAMIANLYVVLFSFSRSGWMSFIAGVVLISIYKKKSILLYLAVLVLCYKIILPTAIIERIHMTTGDSGQLDNASAVRVDVWMTAVKTILTNPIGVGFENFRNLGFGDTGARDAHNNYVKIVVEWGFHGLLYYLMIYRMAYKRGMLLFRIGRSKFFQGIGLGFASCTVINMIGNFFDQHWNWLTVTGNWWVYFAFVEWGILQCINEPNHDDAEYEDEKPKPETPMQPAFQG